MKNNKANHIRLGIFVSLGLVLLISGIYFIGKKQQLFSNTFQVSGIFSDISGLQIGNNVRFSGINVGVIENIQLISDTSVRVDFVIDEDVRKFIKKDARAYIGTDGLMGNKILMILPGNPDSKIIENNDVIETAYTASMDDIMENLYSITTNLSAIMENIYAGRGTIGKLFMDTLFAKNIDQTIVTIKQGAGGFKKNMDAASDNILLRGFFKKKDKDKKEDKK